MRKIGLAERRRVQWSNLRPSLAFSGVEDNDDVVRRIAVTEDAG